jgi:hypothetical protein
MLAHTAEQALVGPGTPDRSLVVVADDGRQWPDDGCAGSWTCAHARRLAIAEQSLAAGIPIVAIGGAEPATDLAVCTGGVAVSVTDPVQYPVALGNLKSIIARDLGYNRVPIVLAVDGISPPPFKSGSTIWAYMSVRVGTDTAVDFPVAIPID